MNTNTQHTPGLLTSLDVASARRANKVVVQFKANGQTEFYVAQARAMRDACMRSARARAAIQKATGAA